MQVSPFGATRVFRYDICLTRSLFYEITSWIADRYVSQSCCYIKLRISTILLSSFVFQIVFLNQRSQNGHILLLCSTNCKSFYWKKPIYSSTIAVGGLKTPAETVRAGGLRRGGALPFPSSSPPSPSPDLVRGGGRRRGSGR